MRDDCRSILIHCIILGCFSGKYEGQDRCAMANEISFRRSSGRGSSMRLQNCEMQMHECLHAGTLIIICQQALHRNSSNDGFVGEQENPCSSPSTTRASVLGFPILCAGFRLKCSGPASNACNNQKQFPGMRENKSKFTTSTSSPDRPGENQLF